MKFVDEVEIIVSSGNGGPGKVSFRREAMDARGGPDGGDGGAGGDIIVRTNRQMNTLQDFRYQRHYQAGHGMSGGGSNCTGRDGEDLILQVPPGTVIKDKEGRILHDLAEDQEIVFLEGGRGGKGNAFFKTSVNQAPEHAQKGEAGQTMEIRLELKLLADVGIIGFPNAGKSTLISHISAARPKIADYPFTTLVPNLGVVTYGEDQAFVVADIPGLVPGAHQGVGLGTQFLRHIQRTRVFVHMIDVSEMSMNDPWQSYLDINNELEQYDKLNSDEEGFARLSERPQIVVFNKIDTVDQGRLSELQKKFAMNGVHVMAISAATGKNLQQLIFKMGESVFGAESKE